MDHYLFNILACPVCHAKLEYDKEKQELLCKFDGLIYPIRDGIPILIETEARSLRRQEEVSVKKETSV